MSELLLITSGASAYLAVYNALAWGLRRSRRMSLWLALWSAFSFVYQVTRYRQAGLAGSPLRTLNEWVCLASVMVLVPLIFMVVRDLTGSVAYPRVPRLLAAGLVVSLALHATTHLFLSTELGTYLDFSGQVVPFSRVGPLYAPVIALASGTTLTLAALMVWRSPLLGRGERWPWLAALGLYQALGAHDGLLFSGETARHFPGVRDQPLFEFAVVALAGVLTLRMARETQVSQAQLERLVEGRTRELAEALVEARSAVTARGAFLASVSHEVRTPLNGILGLTELMLDDPLPPATRERLELVQRSGRTLTALVDQVLDLARSATPAKHDFSLRAALEDMVHLHQGLALQKGLSLRFSASGLPDQVRGDEVRLKQVVANLVSNAVKFTSVGSVRLEASATAHPGGAMLRVEVHDTGRGLSPAEQARLFRPFSQVGRSDDRAGAGGTGLGLAISRQLATELGGTVEVRSAPGEGSVFSFRVPLQVRSWEAPTRALAAAAEAGPRFEGQVLVAEDNPVNRLVTQGMLRSVGLQPTLVEDGAQAVAAARGGAYALVLMDCQMPEVDGLEATRRLRAEGYRVPIIALTAFASAEDRARCLEAGMTDYLTKPLRRSELTAMLDRHLGAPADGRQPRPRVG